MVDRLELAEVASYKTKCVEVSSVIMAGSTLLFIPSFIPSAVFLYRVK
jgi:hypothetical protein